MSNNDNNLDNTIRFLPLAPLDLQVLLLVSDEPLHGYGIVKASKERSGVAPLELGSLYRIISRMTREGLIEDVEVIQPRSKRQRRYYRATQLGRQVVQAEARRLSTLLGSAQTLDLLEE